MEIKLQNILPIVVIVLGLVLTILGSITHASAGSSDQTKTDNAKNSSTGIIVIGVFLIIASGGVLFQQYYKSSASDGYYYF